MIYLAVYNVTSLATVIPGAWHLTGAIWEQKQRLVPWVGTRIMGLEELRPNFNGSGDMTYHYVEVWCYLALALLGALLWWGIDRRRRADYWIGETMRTFLRYVLSGTLLSYGMSKVLHQQMPPPSGFRLVEPVGDMSPMGLLWVFVGQSAAYSCFTGLTEVIPGLLLLNRRTALLGALASAAVMFHVAVLNFCFDVPVKLYSIHLFLFSLFLAAPAFRPLWSLLVLRRPAAMRPWRIRWPHPAVRWIAIALKVVIVANLLYEIPYAEIRRWHEARATPKSELTGFYAVDRFERNGQMVLPALDDLNRWRYVAISRNGITIANMRNARISFEADVQAKPLRLKLTSADEQKRPVGALAGSRAPDGSLDLAGQFGSQRIQLHLRRLEDNDSRLMGRGFNWINERPFNR